MYDISTTLDVSKSAKTMCSIVSHFSNICEIFLSLSPPPLNLTVVILFSLIKSLILVPILVTFSPILILAVVFLISAVIPLQILIVFITYSPSVF